MRKFDKPCKQIYTDEERGILCHPKQGLNRNEFLKAYSTQPLNNAPKLITTAELSRTLERFWYTKSSTEESLTKTFLPKHLVMLDCEMTGVVPERDALLQVAMLRLRLQGNQYVVEGEPLVLYLQHEGQPQNSFHRKYLKHIFKRCNESDLQPEAAKEKICDWLGDLKGKVQPCGDCVPTDMAFLRAKGLIDPSDFDEAGKPIPGTFHYEFFEMNSLKAVARHLMGAKESLADLDTDNIHDALVDCQNQLIEMNHFLKVLTEPQTPAEKTESVEAKLAVDYHTVLFDLDDCISEKDYNFKHTQEIIPTGDIYPLHPYQTEFTSGLEEVPHCTVLFGVEREEDFFPIARHFNEAKPFSFRIGPIKAFRNDDKPYDVLVLEIQSPELEKHHWWIRENFKTNVTFPDYKPHMTLAYIQKGTCRDIEGEHPWMGSEYTCDLVKFSHRDDIRVPMPLRGEQEVSIESSAQPWCSSFLEDKKYINLWAGTYDQTRQALEALDEEPELPPDLAPQEAPVGTFPEGLTTETIRTEFDREARMAASFQDFQELLNKVMIRFGLVETYRLQVAGALNELRIEHGLPAL